MEVAIESGQITTGRCGPAPQLTLVSQSELDSKAWADQGSRPPASFHPADEDPGVVAKLEEKVAVLMAQQQKVLELLANQNQLDTNGIQQVRQQIPKCNNQTHTQEQQPATSEVQESQAGARETMASSFGANLSHFPQKVKPDRSKSSTENM